MLATMIGLCLAVPGAGQGEKSPEYRAGYEKGRAEADRELDAGGATLYAFGLLHDGLDRETGLPFNAIAGCGVGDEILGRTAGHNDRIAQSIEARGLPGNSYKRWEKELFDLKGYFAARGRVGEPRRLTADGPVLAAPGKSHAIQLREIPEERRSAPSYRWELVITSGGAATAVPLSPSWTDAAKTEQLWGPEGSHLAFLRWSDFPPGSNIEQVIAALDVRTGRWLRQEFENRPPAANPAPRAEPDAR